MNNYYHEINIGFNFWYVVLPFLLVVAVIISTMSETQFFWAYDLDAGRQLVRFRRSRCDSTTCILQAVIVAVGTLIVVAMMYQESWSGIIQYCRNYVVSGTSPTAEHAAIVILVVCAIVFFALMAWAVNSGWRLAAAAVLVFDAVLVLAARRTNSRPVKGPDRYDQQYETDPNPRS